MIGAFGENFPYSNFHDLNLDWILDVVKEFKEEYSDIQSAIQEGVAELNATGEEIDRLLNAWYTEHSEDIANELASAIASFTLQAEQIATSTIASIPEDYTDFYNKALIQRANIPAGADMNTYTTAGQYVVLSTPTPAISNWPLNATSKIGRLIVFGNDTDAMTRRVQVLFTANDEIFFRTGSTSAWGAWKDITGVSDDKLIISEGYIADVQESPYSMDNMPINSIVTVPTADVPNVANYPDYSVGSVVMTFNAVNINAGKIQIVYPWISGDPFDMCFRIYINGTWREWKYSIDKITEVHVGSGQDADFSSIAQCLSYYMDDDRRFMFSQHHQLKIILDDSSYSMNDVITMYEADNERYAWGVYIPPYTTIEGQGKTKTTITMNYSGTDDWILGHLSAFNMPYTSTMKNLTVAVRNVRYAVHSDGDSPYGALWRRNNSDILLENVKLIHNGYEEGLNPTYNVPAAWGGGSYNNSNRTFKNCDFIAKQYTPWFNHNRTDLKTPSTFTFDNCTFINSNDIAFQDTPLYASLMFISWGSDIINPVILKDCYLNRNLTLRIRTDQGNESAICDYHVYSDKGIIITESTTNDAHRKDNYIDPWCEVGIANESLLPYRPVSQLTYGSNWKAYDYANNTRQGVTVMGASSGSELVVQTSGLIPISMLTSSTFSRDDLIGYSGGAWVVDTVHPILKMVNIYYAEILNTYQ